MSLRRNPGVAAGAVAAIGAAIWANLLVWSIGLPLVIDPLPFPDAERIVRVWQAKSTSPTDRTGASYGSLLLWRSQSKLAERVAAYGVPARQLLLESATAGEFEAVRDVPVTADFFSVLGTAPLVGRPFDAEQHLLGPNVLMVSHAYWQRRLGGDPNVVGRSIARPDRASSTIVGVMPPGFEYPAGAEVWVPVYVPDALLRDQNSRGLRIVARLRAGVTIAAFRNELLELQGAIAKEVPNTDLNWQPVIATVREELFGGVTPALLALYVIAGVLACLGFGNVLTLMLLQADRRRVEYGVQKALGAPRTVLWTQLGLEGVTLAVIGWMVALLGASVTIGIARSWLPSPLPRIDAIVLDARLIWMSLAASVFTGIAWGVLTAVQVERSELRQSVLTHHETGRADARSGKRLRQAVLLCQVALAVVIVTAAAVAGREVRLLDQADRGFQPRHVVAARLGISLQRLEEIYQSLPTRLPKDQHVFVGDSGKLSHGLSVAVFGRDLIAEVESIPGVKLAALSGTIPLLDDPITALVSPADTSLGSVRDPERERIPARLIEASDTYFRVLGTPLLTGRTFTPRDRLGSEPVAIVSRTLARRLWGSVSPIGQLLSQERERSPVRIVGIVADAAVTRPGEPPAPVIYRPHAQSPPSSLRLLVSSETGAEFLRSRISEVARRLGAHVHDVQALSDVVDRSLRPAVSAGRALSLLALLALGLAFTGLYATSAATLERRRREFGIRLALGATPANVSMLVLKHAGGLALLGTAAGLLLVGLLWRAVSARVQLPAASAGPIVVSVTVVVAAAMLASLRTSIRSRRVNPSTLLR